MGAACSLSSVAESRRGDDQRRPSTRGVVQHSPTTRRDSRNAARRRRRGDDPTPAPADGASTTRSQPAGADGVDQATRAEHSDSAMRREDSVANPLPFPNQDGVDDDAIDQRRRWERFDSDVMEDNGDRFDEHGLDRHQRPASILCSDDELHRASRSSDLPEEGTVTHAGGERIPSTAVFLADIHGTPTTPFRAGSQFSGEDDRLSRVSSRVSLADPRRASAASPRQVVRFASAAALRDSMATSTDSASFMPPRALSSFANTTTSSNTAVDIAASNPVRARSSGEGGSRQQQQQQLSTPLSAASAEWLRVALDA